MAENLKKRIKDKMGKKNLSIASLEREAGLRKGAVQNIIDGRSKNPGAENLKAIARVLECSVDDLLENRGISLKDVEIKTPSETLKEKIDNLDLFLACTAAVVELFKEENLIPSYEEVNFFSKEVYTYSLTGKIVDKQFAAWLIKKLPRDR